MWKTGSLFSAGVLAATLFASAGVPALAAGFETVAQAAPPSATSQGAAAQTSPRTPSPPNATVYFVDLKDGARIPPDVHIRVGLTNMGVAPASVAFPDTGHHHIIVDAPLPPFDEPIPSDDNHIHLGGGQTETDLTLSPGPHTLQLLLGDKDHVPHDPPVYSALIHVTVARPRTPSLPNAEVYFIAPKDGDVIPATSVIRFGLRGMGVAPASVARSNTGQHNLVVDADTPDPDAEILKDEKHLNFDAGETETGIALSPGQHSLQLVFTDHKHLSFDPPLTSKRITVTVSGRAKAEP